MGQRRGYGRLLIGLALSMMLLWPAQGRAEVATDGTLGGKVRLTGKDVTVPARLGQIRGQNLFHSFERFGVPTKGRVTFTGPDGLKNVIGRVTGGERSSIDGTLASKIQGADLWLLNPAGILFGPHARLQVPGSFHASTADELRFADGAVFSALDPQGSVLSVAAPEDHDRPARSECRRARRCLWSAAISMSRVAGSRPRPGRWRWRQQGRRAQSGSVPMWPCPVARRSA
jgi:filamentous hemagglutinin family protein